MSMECHHSVIQVFEGTIQSARFKCAILYAINTDTIKILNSH